NRDRAIERGAGLALVIGLDRGQPYQRFDLAAHTARAARIRVVEGGGFGLLFGLLVRLAHHERDFVGALVARVVFFELLPALDGLVVLAHRRAQQHGVVGGVFVVRALGPT